MSYDEQMVPGGGVMPADEIRLHVPAHARAVEVGDVVVAVAGQQHAPLELLGHAHRPGVRRGRVVGRPDDENGRRPGAVTGPTGRVGGTGHTAQAASPQARSGPKTGADGLSRSARKP